MIPNNSSLFFPQAQESQGSPGGSFGHRPTISTPPTDNKFNPYYDKQGCLGTLVRTHGSVSPGQEFWSYRYKKVE